MKKQKRVTKQKYIEDFEFSLILEDFDNYINVIISKEDFGCRALLRKYDQNPNELKNAIVTVCENWIEELTGNPYYHIISTPIFVFTWERFLYEVNFSD